MISATELRPGMVVIHNGELHRAHSVVHKAGLLDMSTDLPIVIEIVDSDQNVRALLPYLETVVHDGMITMEHVMVLVYRGQA